MTASDNDVVEKIYAYIEEHQQLYIQRLAEAVAIPSVSSELDVHLVDIRHMIDWTAEHVRRLGGTVVLRDNPAGTAERPLPPLLLGEFTADKTKKTVCVYGHLDVQPAQRSDGWDTDPFVLTEKDGKLFGRGSTDDKGPALAWLWTVEAFRDLGMDLPVNIKILYEGLEEFGSEGLMETIQAEAAPGKFLSDVDFFCISDNYWLGKNRPCLTYGLRGLAYFQLSVQGCAQDLHSGVFGGSVHEAMTDLVRLMGSLVDSNGKILVDGVNDTVRPVTAEEEALYETIDFDLETYQKENRITSGKLLHESKKDILMGRWRYPSLSLHGIEGAFAGPGAKTVIPAKVVGKFSVRLVPDQDPAHINQCLQDHVEREFAKYGSPNAVDLTMLSGFQPWISSPHHPNFQAASNAIETVYGLKPDFTREGGSIPVTNAMEDATGMNVLLLPIGASDDMAHSQNEKFNVSNLVNGTKVLMLYLVELGKIRGPKPSSCRCNPLTEAELMVPGAFVKGFRCKCEI